MQVLINCPLCTWKYEVPQLDARINHDTLASVFGPGIMAQHAINSQTQATERALESHLKTHTLVEWVSKVSALETELRLTRAALSEE